jgi:hypothetical protein
MTLSIGLRVRFRDGGHVHFDVFAARTAGREHLPIHEVTRGNSGSLVLSIDEFDELVERLAAARGVHVDVYNLGQPADEHEPHDDCVDALDVHAYMGLSYANYLVLHRSVLQSMPDDWQRAFVALLEEADQAIERHGIDTPQHGFDVHAVNLDGDYIPDPVPHYNRGRTRLFDTKPGRPERCPRCDSPSPHLHPSVQYEGETQPCSHTWHRPIATIT